MKIVYEGSVEYEGKRYPIHVEPDTLRFFLEPLVPGQEPMVRDTPGELQRYVSRHVQEAQELQDKQHGRNDPKNENPAPVTHTQAWLLSSGPARPSYRSVTVRGRTPRSDKALVTHADGRSLIVPLRDLYLGSEDDMRHWTSLMAESQKAHAAFAEAQTPWGYSHLSEQHQAEIEAAWEATVLTYNNPKWVATFPGCEGLKIVPPVSFRGAGIQMAEEILKNRYPYTMNQKGEVVESRAQVSPSGLFPDKKTAQWVAALYRAAIADEKALRDWYVEHAYTFG